MGQKPAAGVGGRRADQTNLFESLAQRPPGNVKRRETDCTPAREWRQLAHRDHRRGRRHLSRGASESLPAVLYDQAGRHWAGAVHLAANYRRSQRPPTTVVPARRRHYRRSATSVVRGCRNVLARASTSSARTITEWTFNALPVTLSLSKGALLNKPWTRSSSSMTNATSTTRSAACSAASMKCSPPSPARKRYAESRMSLC